MGRRGRLRLRVADGMIGVAILTVTGWAIGEAMSPAYAEGWVHSRLLVADGPMQPPFLDSRSPPAQQERHVRQALADDLLREAAPTTRPVDLRGRLRVWCGPSDSIFISTLTRDPADRATIDAIGATFVRRHGGSRWHGATSLDPPTYPKRLAAIVGLSAFWAGFATLALARRAASRRRAKAQLLALR